MDILRLYIYQVYNIRSPVVYYSTGISSGVQKEKSSGEPPFSDKLSTKLSTLSTIVYIRYIQSYPHYPQSYPHFPSFPQSYPHSGWSYPHFAGSAMPHTAKNHTPRLTGAEVCVFKKILSIFPYKQRANFYKQRADLSINKGRISLWTRCILL